MSWNYRVIREGAATHGDQKPERMTLAIHEVHYEGDTPTSVSVNPVAVVCDEEDGLVDLGFDLEAMRQALERPVLEMEYFDKLAAKRREKGDEP